MIIFGSPRRYVQGPDAIGRLGEEVARLGRTAAIVADAQVAAVIGTRVADACAAAGVALTAIPFGGEITFAEIDRMEAGCGALRPEVLIAAGGGKALDAGKLLGRRLGARIVTVPTIASNDAPTSHIIVVYDEAHRIASIERLPANPDLVLVDTAIIARAPAILLSAGIGDAVVKRFEVAQCAGNGGLNTFGGTPPVAAQVMAEACYATLRDHAEGGLAAVARGTPDLALERTVEACVLLSGLAFESGGLSICHAMTRGLSAVPGPATALHGLQVAYALMVQLTLEGRDAAFIEDLRGFFARTGLPDHLAALGFKGGATELRTIAELTVQAPHTKNFPRVLTADDLVAAMRAVEETAQSRKAA